MTSNHISKILNNLIWFILYVLPLIVLIGVAIHTGSFPSIDGVFSALGLTLYDDNIIFYAFDDIFGYNGVLPLFLDTGVLTYAAYFASCYLLHFICDVVLWIVRWAHDMMNKGGRDLWK